MSTEQNKRNHLRFIEESWNKGNLAVIEELAAPGVVAHFLPPGMPPGTEGLKRFIMGFRAAFPDVHIAVEEIVGEGNETLARWTMTGTQQGQFQAIPPTGRKVSVTGIEIWSYDADGKRVEGWSTVDQMGMLQQLGVIPPLGQAGR